MRPWLLKFHRWAGIAACTWLFVLGLTGLLLDHPEWRWLWHNTVPQEWLSQPVGRLLRGTIMRYVVADPENPRAMIGASERGTWWTADGGASWQDVRFEGLPRSPQVMALVPSPHAGTLDGVWIATDDGLWRTRAGGREAEPAGLRGEYLNSLTPGAKPGALVAVADRGEIVRIDTSGAALSFDRIPLDRVEVRGLPDHVSLFGFLFDLHFGEALLQRATALVVNDFAAIALMVLPMTGFAYWYLPRRSRSRRADAAANRRRRGAMDWLYRFHAPVLGLLAAVPILYLSVTGAVLGHVPWLDSWARDVDLDREKLLWTYRLRSLAHEVQQVIAYPGEPERFSIATRLGVLDTRDGGRTWTRDAGLAPSSFNLFREGEVVFASPIGKEHFFRRDGAAGWRVFTGPVTGVTDATRAGEDWIIKNSRSFWRGTPESGFEAIDTPYPPLAGATMYLFVVDVHTGNVIHPQFKWVNDFVAVLAVLLLATGPILWWRVKWR
jgi:hypothetical protein